MTDAIHPASLLARMKARAEKAEASFDLAQAAHDLLEIEHAACGGEIERLTRERDDATASRDAAEVRALRAEAQLALDALRAGDEIRRLTGERDEARAEVASLLPLLDADSVVRAQMAAEIARLRDALRECVDALERVHGDGEYEVIARVRGMLEG